MTFSLSVQLFHHTNCQ